MVLFATVQGAVEQIIQSLQDPRLSPLHRISQVIVMSELPMLGSGKINYSAVAESVQVAA
jgi:acyl-coenzyme A synthetase/AMP-(fatty) acid ligase